MRDARPPLRPSVPQSFQTRLTIAFMGVVALTLVLVAPVVINRLDDYFRVQEEQSLRAQAAATAAILDRFIADTVGAQRRGGQRGREAAAQPRRAVGADRRPAPGPDRPQRRPRRHPAPVRARPPGDRWRCWPWTPTRPSASTCRSSEDPARGQLRDPAITPARADVARVNAVQDWGMSVTLSNPYTSRANTLAAITGLLLVMASIAFMVAVLVAAFIAHRFTTPDHAPDGGLAAAGRGRPRLPGVHRRALVRDAGAAGAVHPVQRDGGPARGERLDHPARPRPEPGLPRRRQPRAAHADRRDADVHRAAPGPGGKDTGGPERVPGLVGRPARPARLAGPEPARAVEARFRAGPAGAASGRHPRHDRVGRGAAAGHRRAQGDHAHRDAPRSPDPDQPRCAAGRPGGHQPRRQRAQVHRVAAGRSG